MAYMEKDKLDTLCQKLENTCEENHLSYKLVTRDPIGIVIRPDMTMEGQITMLDIITCMEDHTMLGRCLDDTAKTPEQSGAIAGMQHYFLELQQVMENSMRSVTVQQLLAEQPA